jgi:hypothetical protein
MKRIIVLFVMAVIFAVSISSAEAESPQTPEMQAKIDYAMRPFLQARETAEYTLDRLQLAINRSDVASVITVLKKFEKAVDRYVYEIQRVQTNFAEDDPEWAKVGERIDKQIATYRKIILIVEEQLSN